MHTSWLHLSAALLLLASPVAANEVSDVEVRGFQDSSTDIFDVLSRLPRAKAAYKAGDFSAALMGYRYVYFHDNSQAEAALGYANSALALGQVDLAQSLFRKLSSDDARTGEVICAVIKGETNLPEAALRARLEVTPRDGRLLNMLGRMMDDKGDHRAARESYVLAGMSGQRPGVSENNMGLSFLSEGQGDKALEYFQRAVLRSPQDIKFDNNRRLALLMQKKYSAALEALDSERASLILSDAGVIALGQDDPKLARFMFEKAQSLSPVYNIDIERRLAQLDG